MGTYHLPRFLRCGRGCKGSRSPLILGNIRQAACHPQTPEGINLIWVEAHRDAPQRPSLVAGCSQGPFVSFIQNF